MAMRKIVRNGILFLTMVLGFAFFSSAAWGLSCGKFNYPKCDGHDLQYAGGFHPQVGFGGFGGGTCRAVLTPVVFIHGNGDRATNWDSPITGAVGNYEPPLRSVYQEFKARGYNDCELFGITYLSPKEQASPKTNYHKPDQYDILIHFIEAVKAYTGRKQVDVVAHSLGASMMLAALSYHDKLHAEKNGWASVRRFVNIAGGIRGLPACLAAGFMNPLVSTCGSQNYFNDYVFGFYPDSGKRMGANEWTGDSGPLSMRHAPVHHPRVLFYTLSAGQHDQIHCSTVQRYADCGAGALFVASANVRAQIHIGAGSKARRVNLDFKNWRPQALSGGDADGIGHFKVRNNSGQIIFEMLNTDCTGLSCKGLYSGGPVAEAH
jgi:pimeloyl-ACP methyl ester carboxylesterase